MLNAASWTARLNELASAAGVPGATLGIWSDGQEILAAHGVLNTTTKVPVSTDSLFQVGSITKIWTATMIMQLVDEGLLSLDTTVGVAYCYCNSGYVVRSRRRCTGSCSTRCSGR